MRHLTSGLAAALLLGVQLPFPATAYADTLSMRAECRKTNTRGCTAAHPVCVAAPDGKYIKPSSFSVGTIVGHWGKNATCQIARAAGHVTYVVPDLEIEAQLPTSICASLHIESGSGPANLGQIAYVDCGYDVVYGQLP